MNLPEVDAFALEQDAQRIETFFGDEAIQRVWRETEESIVAEWKRAPTPMLREQCWSRVQAMRALEARMRAVVGAALRANPEREVRALPF